MTRTEYTRIPLTCCSIVSLLFTYTKKKQRAANRVVEKTLHKTSADRKETDAVQPTGSDTK